MFRWSVIMSNSIQIFLSNLGWMWIKFNITFKANKRFHKAVFLSKFFLFFFTSTGSLKALWQKSRLSKAVKCFHMGWLPYLFLKLLLNKKNVVEKVSYLKAHSGCTYIRMYVLWIHVLQKLGKLLLHFIVFHLKQSVSYSL